MAVTLTDPQHSGNDPGWISPRKVMLNFGAIISTTVFTNTGNTPKGSAPPYVSRSRSRRRKTGVPSPEGQRIAPIQWETKQRCDELLTTLLTVKLRAQEWRFLSRSTTKPPPGPLRTGIEDFPPKIEPFSVFHHLCEQVECFRVFLERSSWTERTLWASTRASTNRPQWSALCDLH